MEELLKVGVITSTHGVRGEVKVFPTTDDVKRFKRLKQVILDTGKEKQTLEIEGVKFFKNMVILKFKDKNTIEDVEKYRQKDLYVERKNAVKLYRDEYFIADLIGLSVFDEEGQRVGTLTDVMSTGANDVYVVELAEDGSYGNAGVKEILLPAIKQCILDVNVEEQRMVVHIMEGLLDL
ncbi:MAG: ribosome maturation factor RimM [Lachnospiraceae bacterium]